jgi:hypothetical protein
MRINPEDYAFTAQFTPVAMARAASGLRKQILVRVISMGISWGIAFILWWYYGRPTSGYLFWALIIGASIPLIWLIVTGVRLALLKNRLAAIGTGPAVRIDPLGLVIAAENGPKRIPWAQVTHIGAKAHLGVVGPELVVQAQGAQDWRTPFSYLDVLPGTIDSAIRAHTGGRRSLDLSKLDRVI